MRQAGKPEGQHHQVTDRCAHLCLQRQAATERGQAQPGHPPHDGTAPRDAAGDLISTTEPLDAPRVANFADAVRVRITTLEGELGLEDRHLWHAPVGSHLPNGFGLLPADGRRVPFFSDSPVRAIRGGSYAHRLPMLRSGCRMQSQAPEYKVDTVGLRAARALTP